MKTNDYITTYYNGLIPMWPLMYQSTTAQMK